MRLVEVVMLMGAHCVSPVEHSQLMTEATKVQCAVVIEKDTDRGTVTVTPQQAARDPQVAAAVARFSVAPVDGAKGASTRIVPAWAPAGSPATEIKPPVAKAEVALPQPVAPPVGDRVATEADTTAATAAAPPEPPPPPASTAEPKAEKKLAMITPPPPKRSTTKVAETKTSKAKKPASKAQPAKATKPGQCKGNATAKWYTTTDGRKKYRCVKPTGAPAPDQIY